MGRRGVSTVFPKVADKPETVRAPKEFPPAPPPPNAPLTKTWPAVPAITVRVCVLGVVPSMMPKVIFAPTEVPAF